VVVPTRDRVDKLRRAVDSIRRQRFRSFDLWIVDDGSRDGTARYLHDLATTSCEPGDPAVHVVRHTTQAGAAAARNRALRSAGGELIAFLDDDDAWHPDYLRLQVATLDGAPDAAASVAGHTLVDARGRPGRPDMRPLFDYGSPVVHMATEWYVHTMSAVVCRREAFDALGLLDRELRICHDVDWYIRLLHSGRRIVTVEAPPLVVRESPGGLVRNHRLWYREEAVVLGRAFRRSPACARERRRVLAHRSLLHARVASHDRDYAFAAARVWDAFRRAPGRSARIVLRRLYRNLAGGRRGPGRNSVSWSRGP
jgi:glycosyltransferase involved in cell wall biosynthesis